MINSSSNLSVLIKVSDQWEKYPPRQIKKTHFYTKQCKINLSEKNDSLEVVIINCVIRSFINYKTISNDRL